MDKRKAILYLRDKPYCLGKAVGFSDLTLLHNDWIKQMMFATEDESLQSHRGSYKTTCVSIALSILILMRPSLKIMFMRKTDEDIKEVIKQVQKILLSEAMQCFSTTIYKKPIVLTTASTLEINTNLSCDIKGTSQLCGMGLGSSLTGKHFDVIFTDDIVNVKDRISRAERDRTKIIYQELQNVKNRGGRIFNTGTPWHKDDCFTIMPQPKKWDCYTTGLISSEQLEQIKSRMTSSLFCANYELKHIADDDVIFSSPHFGAEPYFAEQGIAHIDASYGGEDYTAFTICKRRDGKYYVLGKLFHKHVDDCEDEIINLRKRFNAGKIYCENNGDKGYLAKQLRGKGERVSVYHEDMNKYIKITTYLKCVWNDVYFVEGTDVDYINQVCDYNENAEHDDAPDSLASIIRRYSKQSESEYVPIFM